MNLGLNNLAELLLVQILSAVDEDKINTLINLLNEKEVLLKERELALEEQQEEFLAQKEELNAAVEELIAKNAYLTNTLEKLKKRNSELDHILYRASHDLKTPVSSTYGLIQIIRSGTLSEDQHLAVLHLHQQARQMEMRLLSLTDLSGAFFNKPEQHTFSIKSLIDQIWNSIDRQHNIEMVFLTEDFQLFTDPAMLTIALKCLLSNSTTYCNKVLPSYVKISFIRKTKTVEIEIIDNGEGIDPNISTHIFDMFYRGSERSKGFGLGLYIARTIAEKLNGIIQHVPLQRETMFRLILPA
jgi:signal transduction histidine kinase